MAVQDNPRTGRRKTTRGYQTGAIQYGSTTSGGCLVAMASLLLPWNIARLTVSAMKRSGRR